MARSHSYAPRFSNVHGMLLEEAVLWLLENSGYQTVLEPGNDPTLGKIAAGLTVKGRGTPHQIDAISDFRIQHPFSHPQRLLLEAKCLREGTPVELETLRGAVGVLKDVNEYWVTTQGDISKQRYHYQYALFSATGYSRNAQAYAFAQDIYLIPIENSRFFQPVIQSIRAVRPRNQSNRVLSPKLERLQLSALRQFVRGNLRERQMGLARGLAQLEDNISGLGSFFVACHEIRFALLAVLGSGFPVFLVPAPLVHVEGLRNEYFVTITWDDKAWYLRDQNSQRLLFSFDLPRELFLRYAKQGTLTPQAALDLKRATMSNFYAFYIVGSDIRLIQFRLDHDWLNRLEAQLKSSNADNDRPTH